MYYLCRQMREKLQIMCICNNIPTVANTPFISVLMPVYNGEKTLPRSLDSLLDQGVLPFELVIVNDCSTDHTQALLEQFAKNAPKNINVKVIYQEENGGVAKARNVALSHAKGEYILWLDADDYYVPNAFEKLLALPKSDIIGYNYYLQSEGKSRVIDCPHPNTPKSAFRMVSEGKMKWNLWAFMIKRDLIVKHNIHFLSGHNMGEDLYFMGQALLYAQDIQMLHQPMYHYIISNESSLTNNYRPKHYDDIMVNVNGLEQIMLRLKGKETNDEINFLKLTLKLPFLYTRDHKQYKMWQHLFPEADQFIDKYPTPHLYNRWLQKWALRGQYLLIDLFNMAYSVAYRLRY